jgi:hypothetical protein
LNKQKGKPTYEYVAGVSHLRYCFENHQLQGASFLVYRNLDRMGLARLPSPRSGVFSAIRFDKISLKHIEWLIESEVIPELYTESRVITLAYDEQLFHDPKSQARTDITSKINPLLTNSLGCQAEKRGIVLPEGLLEGLFVPIKANLINLGLIAEDAARKHHNIHERLAGANLSLKPTSVQ